MKGGVLQSVLTEPMLLYFAKSCSALPPADTEKVYGTKAG